MTNETTICEGHGCAAIAVRARHEEESVGIVARLNAACVGHPYARIPWPHRLLHDAREEIERLRKSRDEWTDRAMKAQAMLTELQTR